MDSNEIEKSKVFVTVKLVEYVPNSIASNTITRKTTGIINVSAFDSGMEMAENISPFDTFIQIIEGSSEIRIDGILNVLTNGQCIIIPAHSRNTIKATARLKMISTTIKSGYED